jgi:hypothetical protein
MNVLTKIIVTSVTLAPLIAAGAAHGQANRAASGSNDVRAGDRVIGQDPDPFIRGEILRHHSLGYK